MKTAADHLRAQSARLRYLLDNTPISGAAADAVHSARRIVDLVASDLACEKVRIAEPAAVAPADPRAAVRALRREASELRNLAVRSGPAFAPHVEDLAHEADARATALERTIPPRPWARYAVAALACYVAGAATALAIVGAL